MREREILLDSTIQMDMGAVELQKKVSLYMFISNAIVSWKQKQESNTTHLVLWSLRTRQEELHLVIRNAIPKVRQ